MIDRLREIRKKHNLSQKEFAELLSLTKNFISLVENGDRKLSDRTVNDICRIFSIRKEWLMDGTGPMELEVGTVDEFSKTLSKLASTDDYLIKDLLTVYVELDDTEREVLRKIASEFAKRIIK